MYTGSDNLKDLTGPSQQIGGSFTWNFGYWYFGFDQGQPDVALPPSSTEDLSPTFTAASNPPIPTDSSVPPGPSVTPPRPTPSRSSKPPPLPPASPTPPASETASGLPASITDPRPTSINIKQFFLLCGTQYTRLYHGVTNRPVYSVRGRKFKRNASVPIPAKSAKTAGLPILADGAKSTRYT